MSYYFPEDIRLAWASILPEMKELATHNGGKSICFSFICIGGIVQWQKEPVAEVIEPVSQSIKPTRSYDWFQVIRSLQSAVSQIQGRCMVSVSVLVSPQGEPILWTKPNVSVMVAVARE